MTVKEKILKIMALALEINPPEIKNIGEKRTAVFVHWYPHCNELCIDICYDGWRRGTYADECISVYCWQEDVSEKLDDTIVYLEKIKADIVERQGEA